LHLLGYIKYTSSDGGSMNVKPLTYISLIDYSVTFLNLKLTIKIYTISGLVLCEIWDFHSSADEDSSLLGSYIVAIGMFQRILPYRWTSRL
jgi:hypothetical protein